MASAALLAAGCSTENKAEGTEYGTLKVSCTADGSIDAASDDTSRMPAAPSVPQAGDFTLTVTGESGTQKWDTLTEFEQSDAVFRMGTYTVSVAHGDPDAEGIDKPYYAAEKRVEVLPRRAATVEMTATIANSQTVVRATEQFLNYFHDAQFTVTTASGNQFDFTPGSTPADEPVFVKSATTLKVTGTARRQSQTGTDEGPKVTFSEQTLEATSPRTCHIFTFDAKDAGSVTLTVTLSDDLHRNPADRLRGQRGRYRRYQIRNKNSKRYEDIYQTFYDVGGCSVRCGRLCERRTSLQGGTQTDAGRRDGLPVGKRPFDAGGL